MIYTFNQSFCVKLLQYTKSINTLTPDVAVKAYNPLNRSDPIKLIVYKIAITNARLRKLITN